MLTCLIIVAFCYCLPDAQDDPYVFLRLPRTNVRCYCDDGVRSAVHMGYINRFGDFRADPSLKDPIEPTNSNYAFDVYSRSWSRHEKVYEFRSGMLVPGILALNHEFIPVKESIISMDEYLEFTKSNMIDLELLYKRPESFPWYNPKMKTYAVILENRDPPVFARRVYNLPGVFVRKSKYEEEKKRLEFPKTVITGPVQGGKKDKP
jgi:hypothetical protein